MTGNHDNPDRTTSGQVRVLGHHGYGQPYPPESVAAT